MNTETHQFQAEVRQLLDIVINALYSDREIFVRELVSNASDALEKLRLKQLTDSNIYQPDKPLEITVTTDKENKTITIADTGIGMTEADLVENLGTIAHSGTKKFMEALKQKQEGGADLIGQFGVGFYSSFMVADRVEVFTHSYEPEAASLRWSSDGREGYSIETLAEPLDRGTRIVIRLKDEYEEFSQEYRVKELLRRYSNFVGFPLNFNGERVNTVQAIWSKSKSDVKPEEYDEFYQFIAHTDEKPLSYMHFSADAPIALNALLFIPRRNPEMFGFGRVDANVALYCKRVAPLPERRGGQRGPAPEHFPRNASGQLPGAQNQRHHHQTLHQASGKTGEGRSGNLQGILRAILPLPERRRRHLLAEQGIPGQTAPF